MNYIRRHCGISLCHKTNMSRFYRIHFCATPSSSSQLSGQILRETVYRLSDNQIKQKSNKTKLSFPQALPSSRNMTNCNPKANGLSISLTALRVTISVGIWFSEVSSVIKNKTTRNGASLSHGLAPGHAPAIAFSLDDSSLSAWLLFIWELFNMS